MTFLATGLQGHDRSGQALGRDRAPIGALASLGRGLREALAYAGAGQIANQLNPHLDSLRRLAADGTIGHLGVGLSVANVSAHTLEYELVALRMNLEGRQGVASELIPLRGEIAPGRTAQMAQCMAPVAPLGAGRTLQGAFEFELSYGPRGGPRHRLAACYGMAFKSGSAQEIAAFTWYPI